MSVNTEEQQEHFQDVLKHFDSAMLVSMTLDEKIRSRPMVIADSEDDCTLWFVTNRFSGKVDEFEQHPQVNVSMQGGGRFLSLSGIAMVAADRAKLEEIWNEAWKVWFPEGMDDPEICLVKVTPEDGAYWDNSGTSQLMYLYRAGVAYFQGKKPEINDDIHGSVDFKHMPK